MIDLEHCTILGNETVDANSLNRCMFNLHRKMVEASSRTVGATSENIPSSPFFSGGYDDALEIPYISETGVLSATDTYAKGLGYFDFGVKVAYHFNFPKQPK
jgi:hypothetical protein